MKYGAHDNEVLTIKIKRGDALRLGLLTCECGHPANNHHMFTTTACAAAYTGCKCKMFLEKAKRGEIVRSKK